MLVIKNVSALHYCTIKMSERVYDGVERESGCGREGEEK